MKIIVIITGILLLGVIAYYGYGVEESSEINKVHSSDKVIEEKVKSTDTEVVVEDVKKEAERVKKSSLKEDIPTKEVKSDIIKEEESSVTDKQEDIEADYEKDKQKDIITMMNEEEALMKKASKEKPEAKDDNKVNEAYISKEEIKQKAEKEKAGVPFLGTEEEKITHEEDEENKKAIAEDNVNE